MGKSLQDQLLAMGVANKKQAKAAKVHKQQQHKHAQKAQKTGVAAADAESAQVKATQARKDKAAQDKALNEQRENARADKAINVEIGQMVQSNEVKIPPGVEVPFHFKHNKTVKKLYVNAELQQQLIAGVLAITVVGERYFLVPVEVAKRIQQRDPARAIFIEQESATDADDPYADYVIPDDLMW